MSMTSDDDDDETNFLNWMGSDFCHRSLYMHIIYHHPLDLLDHSVYHQTQSCKSTISANTNRNTSIQTQPLYTMPQSSSSSASSSTSSSTSLSSSSIELLPHQSSALLAHKNWKHKGQHQRWKKDYVVCLLILCYQYEYLTYFISLFLMNTFYIFSHPNQSINQINAKI